MSFASVYPHYVKKAEAKGRTRELDEIIRWLTGYTGVGLAKQIEKRTRVSRLLRKGPEMEPQRPAHHRHRLRHPRRKYRGPTDAKTPIPRQTRRRTRKREEDGEDFAEGGCGPEDRGDSRKVTNQMDKLYIIWKRLLSYTKSDWNFSDYPVRVSEMRDAQPGQPKYYARILNWYLGGFGETPDAAVDDLRTRFENFKENRAGDVKRPGLSMPIEFASQEGLEKHDETAERFIDEVLGFGPSAPVFISDESSLLDFTATEEETIDYVARTNEVFGVDISDITDGNLLKIFERIDGLENSQK
jgi:hypothetical protein